jgi:hypothetical protein
VNYNLGDIDLQLEVAVEVGNSIPISYSIVNYYEYLFSMILLMKLGLIYHPIDPYLFIK